jgi:hypothetical protein
LKIFFLDVQSKSRHVRLSLYVLIYSFAYVHNFSSFHKVWILSTDSMSMGFVIYVYQEVVGVAIAKTDTYNDQYNRKTCLTHVAEKLVLSLIQEIRLDPKKIAKPPWTRDHED